ncbi:MAG: hypothetical protein SGBAC_008187 [Bacillariaceae sp.]
MVSLGAGAVSFTHIVKAMEPFFSAMVAGLYFNKWMKTPVYLTLVPVVGGVGYACLKELNFSWLAFGAAMSSNLFFALRAVMSKLALQSGDSGSNLTPPNMFGMVTWAAFFISVPIALIGEGKTIGGVWKDALASVENQNKFLQSLVLSGLSHYLNNEVMYLALGKVHPVTLAVGNTMKRVFILVASVMVFRNPISIQAGIGSGVGIGGVLLAEARARAQLSKQKKEDRSFRRQTIHGALEGILGDSICADDWSIDGESLCSVSSQQSAATAPTTKKNNRYKRRGSVTKYSLDPVNPSGAAGDKMILGLSHSHSHRISQQQDALPSSVHSAETETTPKSSFPEIPSECTTIDSLPLPMKKTKKKSKKKDSISKYSSTTASSSNKDILAASLHEDPEKRTMMKKRLSKLETKPGVASVANVPDSPESTASSKASVSTTNTTNTNTTTKKKKKKELKLRKDKKQESSDSASVSSKKSEVSKKRRQKRRCSVTKYNLPQEVENQMDTSFSGPIPLPVTDPAPSSPPLATAPESPKQAPVSPIIVAPSSSPKSRHSKRRTSVTAYTPGIMDAAGKSPGALGKKRRPFVSDSSSSNNNNNNNNNNKTLETKSPGLHRRRNSVTKYSLEKATPKNFPAAA